MPKAFIGYIPHLYCNSFLVIFCYSFYGGLFYFIYFTYNAIIFRLGLVCTFVTNERMQEAARDLPNSARASVYDTKKFLNVTHKHADTLLTVNYQELQTSLLTMLQSNITFHYIFYEFSVV